MLQIWLLGQFDVRVDGKRTVVPSRAAQSLLAFLVLSSGTPHRREKLAGIFWPEVSDENARHHLRHELWRLRKAITSPQPTSSEYLLAEELTITFNADAAYWLDVAQLTRATTSDDSVKELISDLTFYRGELLPGFYEDWAVLERERVQAIFEGKIQHLLERLITEERWLTAIEWAERWIALGQTPEPAYRALMIAHGAQGDMSKVALNYERCVERLREEIGVAPSADTRALYETLMAGGRAATIAPSVPPILLQPSGTVTFLFSDIEGSTEHLERLGAEYATLLADQRDLLREMAEKYHGHEVDTQGDAFFFAFFRAVDAISFAADAQRALASHQWPQGATLRVRMGLHTGEPMLARTGYVGLDVHRAARIGSAGHGGQVLLSQTTRDLVEHDLPPGTRLEDLGEHKLKDLRYPVHIIQLTIEDLPSDFPPLKTLDTGSEPPAPGEPPFKGLHYFDERDADLFFGRERLTAKLVGRLRESNFLAVVVGASGSGKSSIVRAGVIPALRQGAPLADGTLPPADSQNWRFYVITPTAHPLQALATELTRDVESVTATATLMDDLASEPRSLHLFLKRQTTDSRFPDALSRTSRIPGIKRDDTPPTPLYRQTLLVIDQFEELFTLCHDELEREQFIDNLLTAISNEADRLVTLILTIRADFYAYLAQYPDLRDAVAQHQEYLGPMTVEELRRAIEEPAKQRVAQDGLPWEFEPGLVDLMLRDVGDEPGALPLLSHALLETWKRRSGHTLTLKGYAEAGGVRGAIAQTAETSYQALTPEQQTIARNLFLRLTELGEGTEDTRRRASFNELIPRGQDAYQVRTVLTKLADARLITTSADNAEVAHEALIREWNRLREWLNQDREGLRLHRQLTEAARDWELLERDTGALFRGVRLAQAKEFAQANPNGLNEHERAFLEASVENEKREEREREEARQRELLAKEQLLEAEQVRLEQEQEANARLRRFAVLLAGAFILALVLAALALLLGDRANQNAATAEQNAQAASHAQAAAMANADAAQKAKADADTQRDAAQKSEANAVAQRRIATSRELAATALNQIDVDPERAMWIAQQAVKTTYDVDHTVLPEAADALHRAVQSSQVEYKLSGQVPPMNAAALSPDASRVVIGSANDLAKVYDAATGQELLTLKGHEPNYKIFNLNGGVLDVAYSPEGTRIATGGLDSTARIWDAATGQQLLLLKGNGNGVESVAFNADGSRLATAGGDGTTIIWDVGSGKKVMTLAIDNTGNPRFGNSVQRAVFSPDGRYIAAASTDQTVRVWDAATGKQLWQVPDFWSLGIAFSPDNQLLASGGFSTTVRIFAAATGQVVRTFAEHEGLITDVEFSPDGKRIASASSDHTVKIWDPRTGQVLQTLVANNAWVLSARFGADGKRLVTAGLDGTAKLWDLNTGKPLMTLRNPFDPSSEFDTARVQFSPNGTRVAVETLNDGANGAVKVWSVAPDTKGKLLQTLPSSPWGLASFRWSADGTRLATLDSGKNGETLARTWDMTSNEPLGREVMSTTVASTFIIGTTNWFDAGLAHVAFRAGDGTTKVFDLKTGKLLQTLPSQTQNGGRPDFSPDGARLVTMWDHATARVWDLTTGQAQFSLEHKMVNRAVYSSDGKRIATISDDGTVKIWDSATGKELLTIFAHSCCINAVAFNADGTRLATGAQDTSVKVWDTGTGKLLFNLLGHTEVIEGISFSPDGSQIATVSRDGTIRIWSTTLRDEVGEWAGDLFAINADATRLAMYKLGGGLTVQTWDTAKDSPFAQSRPRLSFTLPIQDELFDGVSMSRDWKYIGTGLSDGTVQIWDAASGKQVLSFRANQGGTYNSAFNADSTRLLTVGDDPMAKVWDLAGALKSGIPPTLELLDLSGHGLSVNDAVFSPDGTRIATGTTGDGLIKVWDAATGKELMTLAGHTLSIYALAFSPDGKRIGSGSRDNTAKIWDAETGKELFTLRGHSGPIIAVAFSRGSKLIATASQDGSTKVWDGVTGAELLTFATPGNPFLAHDSIAFSPDGTRLFVDEGDDGVREYVLPIEDLMHLARSRVTRTLTDEECQQYLHMEQCAPTP